MITTKDFEDSYWNYYLSLEKQFCDIEKYVKFDLDVNRNTYSVEFLKLYQAVCSEIDVLGKEYARYVDTSYVPTKNRIGLNEWWYVISKHKKNIEESVRNTKDGYAIKPWENYAVCKKTGTKGSKFVLDKKTNNKAKTPSWWTDYNDIKHERINNKSGVSNFSKANFGNLLYAFSALFILESEFAKDLYSNERTKMKGESVLFKDSFVFYHYTLEIR